MIEQRGMREKKQDRLAPVRDIFATFVEKCKKCYSFGQSEIYGRKEPDGLYRVGNKPADVVKKAGSTYQWHRA